MYNYPRFKATKMDLKLFEELDSYQEALDEVLYTLSGKKVRLSDYRGKWLVVEAGSSTCPIYVDHIPPMAKLVDKYKDKDVEFVVLYTREAHPGSKVGPHKNLDEKMRCARQLSLLYKEKRTILVDGIEGRVHHSFGLWPNMLYVVNAQGRIVYRSNWCHTEKLDRILMERSHIFRQDHLMPNTSSIWRALFIHLGVLSRSGWNAVFDLLVALPQLFIYEWKLKMKAESNKDKGA